MAVLGGDRMVTRGDLGTILPTGPRDTSCGWLNDSVIDAYLGLVAKHGMESSAPTSGRRLRRGPRPRCHAFSTKFFTTLRKQGTEAALRSSDMAPIRGEDLLEAKHVFIPVHHGAHWTLLVVSPAKRTIEYFDSLQGRRSKQYTDLAKAWLASILGDKFVEGQWQVLVPRSPQQGNSSDCGVFLVTTARLIMQGIDPMSYGSADIPLQRRRMVAELISRGVGEEFF